MTKKENSFVENECILAIKALAIKYPNDMILGNAVRSFLRSITKDKANELYFDQNDGENN
tara:strand:+ start:589 stop:768 length:180 start_codon:yes stop_codon:yes gene_type:complete